MIPMQWHHGLAGFALTAILVCAGAGRGAAQEAGRAVPDGVDNDSFRRPQHALPPEKAQPAAPPLPEVPRVRLAPVPGFDDEAAHMRSIVDRVSQLTTFADQAGDPMSRTDFLLAAANLILAHQLEPGCTKRLLHICGDGDECDEAAVRSALGQADALLARADTALGEIRDGTDLPVGGLRESRHRLTTLQAFASGLRAYLLPGEDAESARESRRAASRLSPLLEDTSRPVVAAATLWQACLRGRESDPSPALSVLDLALADPPPESMPYAFYARLLRCRLVADRGGVAAALALLMQIEERCNHWLTGKKERKEAIRAARLVRIQILADWHDHLGSSGSASERQWCVDRKKGLVAEQLADDNDTVLRLTPAIPILAPPPDANGPSPDTAPEGS